MVIADTIHVPSDHTSIQEAIDVASDGDTVRIAAGTYSEGVEVSKRISIEGDGPGLTVLGNDDGHVIKVTSDRCRISNMTIDGKNMAHGVWIRSSDRCRVDNVTFVDCIRGIFLDNVDDSEIINCTFNGSSSGAWVQHYSYRNVFRSCEFLDCSIGWTQDTGGEPSRNNTLVQCEFRGNTYRAVVVRGESFGTAFIDCTIEGNEFGVDMDEATSSSFIDCRFHSNKGDGLKIDDCQGLVVRDCVIDSNAWFGMNVTSSSSVLVTNTVLVSNSHGIGLASGTLDVVIDDVTFDGTLDDIISIDGSENVTVANCVLNNSRSGNGMGIGGGSQLITVRNTRLLDISNYGCHIWSAGNITIEDCQFLHCGDGGVRTRSTSDIVVRSCTFESCDFAGLNLAGTRTLVTGVDSHNSSHGIALNGARDVTVRSSDLSMNRIGFRATFSTSIDVEDTRAEGCTDMGFWFWQSADISLFKVESAKNSKGAELGQCYDVEVTTSVIRDNENVGLHALECADLFFLNTNFSNTTVMNGLSIEDRAENVTLSECAFRGNKGWGAYALASTISRGEDVHVDNCTFVGNGKGLLLYMLDDSSVLDSVFTGNGDPGIECRETENLTVAGCLISENEVGAVLYGNENATVNHCSIVENRMDGINISGWSLTVGVRLHNSTINGNGLAHGNHAGVLLHDYRSGNVVEDNVMDGNAVGIELSWKKPGGFGNVIRRNIISNSTVTGLLEDGPVKPNLIHLNMFVANAAHVTSPDDNEMFDDGELGNYWDDYRERYPNAKRVGLTWDTPYEVVPGSRVLDYHPLCFWSDEGPPVADAGPDLTVGYGEQFTLDGSASWDDNEIDAYLWSINIPGEDDLVFATISPSPRLYRLGTFVATLTVTDVFGNWDTDTANITVVDEEPPVADAGEELTVGMDETFVLDGTSSWDNVGIDQYQWSLSVEGELWEVSKGTWTLSLPKPGVYTSVLRVTDMSGNVHEDTVNITVLDSEAPHADGGGNHRVDQGTYLTFDGSASWDNVGVVSHTWYLRVGTTDITRDAVSFDHTFDVPGRYVVRLVVYDAAGNSDEDRVTVTVLDTEDPVARAGEDVTVDQDADVILDGSGSTDNVGIFLLTWTYLHMAEVVEVTDARLVVRFPDVGEHPITLRAEDEAGNWGEDVVVVRVRDSTDPVAMAGDDVTVEEGSRITLTAEGSSDNVGIVGCVWTFEYGDRPVRLEGQDVNFTFERPGTYNVVLTVVDAEGNEATDEMVVDVTPVDVFGGPASYLLLLLLVIVVVLVVLWRLRPRGNGG